MPSSPAPRTRQQVPPLRRPRSRADSLGSGGMSPRSPNSGRAPASPRASRLPADTLRQLERQGQRCFANGDFPSAVQHTTRCVKALQGELASLLALRSAIQLQQKEFAAAMADADSAIQLSRGWYKGYLRKGAVLLAMNAPMEAAEHLEMALSMNQGSAEVKRTLREAYKAIANSCYEQGHYEFAIRWNDHALEILRSESTLAEEELGQQCALCYSNRSSANLRQNNVREALRDAELACFNNPWWAKGWLQKGAALATFNTPGDLESALDSLEEALMLEPRSVEAKRKLQQARAKLRELTRQPQEALFETSLSEFVDKEAPTADQEESLAADEVPHFHSEWARYHEPRISKEQMELGVTILYDSYLQACNIKLHLFSLETYEWTGEDDAVWHRVGCSAKGRDWYHRLRRRPKPGAVRDLGGDEAPRTPSVIRNHSFTHYPPPKLTLQVHGTVGVVAFHFTDLLVLLLSTVVYADGSSVLSFVGYEASAYSIAKSAVIAQMMIMDAPLDCVVQVWFSSGWSHETESAFRLACRSLVKAAADPAALSNRERQDACAVCAPLPYKAKVIVQIWSGTASVPRETSLQRWRVAHRRQDLGFLAANLREARDRVDYCQYFLNGELLHCEVGSITMFADYSEVQQMVSSESVLQAIPLLPIETAYEKGELVPTLLSFIKRRVHIMRLRLRKRRLKLEFHMSPLPSDPGTALGDPRVAPELAAVRQHKARYFYWGALPDVLGPITLHDLVERCGAQHARNFAVSLRWGESTFGTHLLDYDRVQRGDLLESLWREAQHGVQATAPRVLRSRPFAHPFHLCQWGLARRYQRAWANHFFLSAPDAVVHDVSLADFSPFTLFPLMLQWTPKPHPDPSSAAGPVRSASPPAALAPTDLGQPDEGDTLHHTTTIHCHVCNRTTTLEERQHHRHGPHEETMENMGPEKMGIMMSVFDAAARGGGD
eukprot:TRINITY_DN50237_c0_g1_i1.p1 TRINITY_DN50237_c0_g1~~TRINITY_DN50237_c0_g1_i1.p1  ORF type:complete len:975 (+),score=308.10 TRINITY_DN50237_c0_g1_i1:76-2925(+)